MLKMKVRNIPERVLIIWGSDDRLFPLEVGLRFHNYLGPNGQIRVVDGGRHALNIEFPREVNRAMLDFLL
jgi:pimeloyl-ACP methyl ester carboxylesterase